MEGGKGIGKNSKAEVKRGLYDPCCIRQCVVKSDDMGSEAERGGGREKGRPGRGMKRG